MFILRLESHLGGRVTVLLSVPFRMFEIFLFFKFAENASEFLG